MSVVESAPLNVAKRLLHKGRAGEKKSIGKNDQLLVDASSKKLDGHDNNISNGLNHANGQKTNKNSVATPAIVKRQQIMKNTDVYNSPTDNFLSPCSQRLWKPKKDVIRSMRLKLDDSPSKGNIRPVEELTEDEAMEEDRPPQLESSMDELNYSTST